MIRIDLIDKKDDKIDKKLISLEYFLIPTIIFMACQIKNIPIILSDIKKLFKFN